MKYIKQSLLLLAIATSCGSFLHAGKLHVGKLHELVTKGDVKKVEQFLNDNKNIDIDEQDDNNNTLLRTACSYNKIEIVKFLLSHGADVNKPAGYDNDTPLRAACFYGYIEIVKLLLSHGADVNKPGCTNDTPLKTACYYGYIEIVKLLLSHGADVNKPGYNSNTPLKTACAEGYIEIVKILLSHGADINKPCYNNETPFNEIKKWPLEKQNELFKSLLSFNKFEDKDETTLDTNTRLFIEFNAADHADSFNQNKTLVPFIITNQQRNNLLLAGGFEEVKNKEFIISIGEELLNTLFFRLEKNKKNTLPPVFVFEQSKMALHPYVKQLKIQRDTLIFKNHNIKSYDDLIYKIKLLAFAQKSRKKWNKKQKSKVQFEDVTLKFKSDNSNSWVNFNSIKSLNK